LYYSTIMILLCSLYKYHWTLPQFCNSRL